MNRLRVRARLRGSIQRWLGLAALWTISGLGAPVVAQEPAIWLGHLTSLPIQSASEQVEALDALARYVDSELEDRQFDWQLYRRHSDALEAFTANANQVDLVLADPAFFLSLPAEEFVPVGRFVTDQGETVRRLLVVRSDASWTTPKALRGEGSLTLVEVTGDRLAEVSSRTVFGGLVDPETYFTEVRRSPDDFAAVADVLYGETDAALIVDDNPLLRAELNGQLRALHASDELSRPVLAARRSAWDAESLQRLSRVLAAAESSPEGRQVLAGLGLTRFAALDPGQRIGTLLWRTVKFPMPDIDLPTVQLEGLREAVQPTPELLEWRISVELPTVPLDPAETP